MASSFFKHDFIGSQVIGDMKAFEDTPGVWVFREWGYSPKNVPGWIVIGQIEGNFTPFRGGT